MDDYTGLIHLDSNVIDDRCNNTQSSFTNYTSGNFRYTDEDYEVGLLEIHIPYTWLNLDKNNYIGIFRLSDNTLMDDGLVPIREGFYENTKTLVDHCNNAVFAYLYPDSDDKTKHDFILYNNQLKRIYTSAIKRFEDTTDERKQGGYYFRFTTQLASVLGIEARCFEVFSQMDVDDEEATQYKVIRQVLSQKPDMTITKIDTTKLRDELFDEFVKPYTYILFDSTSYPKHPSNDVSQKEPSVFRGIEELFVYCSIIKHHMIGNTFKQILRVTPVFPDKNAERGQPIVLSYDNPHYFPLFDSSFDKVEVQMRDRAGNLINFETGSTIVILDIRRKKNGE